MEFKFTRLTKREDCDQLIAVTEKEKAILVYRREGLLMQEDNGDDVSAEIEAALQNKIIEVTNQQSLVESLPDGNKKDEAIVKFKKLDYEKSVLESRQKKNGVVSLISNEYIIDAIERRIAGAESFIAAVKTRMNEL